jgi:hypothetical protein
LRANDALPIELGHQSLAFDAGEADIAGIAHPVSPVTVHENVFDAAEEPFLESVAQRLHVADGFVQALIAVRSGAPQTGNTWHVFSSSAPIVLLISAMNERNQPTPVAREKSARSLRSVQFVAGKREVVDRQFSKINRQPTNGLRRIDVKWDAMFVADLTELGDRLEDACLAVGPLNGDKIGWLRQRGAKLVRRNAAGLINVKVPDGEAAGLEMLGNLQH